MIEKILQQTHVNELNELLVKAPNRLLTKDRKRKNIIIGAPHHGHMRNSGRRGDKNVGFIAWEIAEQLKVCSIIACNYSIDPNKKLDTNYSKQIINRKPTFLIEIHGHSGRKKERGIKRECNDKCIEISSGNRTRRNSSVKFAETLAEKFQKYKSLKDYNVYGEFERLHFQASESATITTNLWMPFHIELPSSIRKDKKMIKNYLILLTILLFL